MDQTPKTLDPTIPIMQLSEKTSLVCNAGFLLKILSLKPKLKWPWWHHQGLFILDFGKASSRVTEQIIKLFLQWYSDTTGTRYDEQTGFQEETEL